MKGPLLLTLALALLLVVGVLYAGKAAGAPIEADALSSCQPVTDIELGYAPAVVYPGTAVLLAAESVSASLPLTYSWEFGDATAPISGTAASAKFTVTHAYSATGVYTVALTTWNTCTVAPLTAQSGSR